MGRTVVVATVVFLSAALAAVPRGAHGQMRRSATPEGAASAVPSAAPKGIPRSERHPFAGVWDGSMTLVNESGEGAKVPRLLVIDVADSVNNVYTGATILPNNARAPHVGTAVANGAMRWKQPNSGGGFWVYAVRLVARDSIAGTVALEDWPQLTPGQKPPSGTIALVRRQPGS